MATVYAAFPMGVHCRAGKLTGNLQSDKQNGMKSRYRVAPALARGVAEEWVVRALAKRIDIGFEDSGRPLWIDGVPLLLQELLNNLLDNAIKYTPPGGHVTLRTRAAQQAVIEVEDDGIGIPFAERGRIFERFYRVLGTDSDGSGLGLTIVAEIAELHRASVELFTGSGGKGSLFRVSFARGRASAGATR